MKYSNQVRSECRYIQTCRDLHFTSLLQVQLGTVLYGSRKIKHESEIFVVHESRNPRQKRDERRSWGENVQWIREKYGQNKKTSTRGLSPRRNLLDIWCGGMFWEEIFTSGRNKRGVGNRQLSAVSLLPIISLGYRKVVRIWFVKSLTRLGVEKVENILVGLSRKRDQSNRMPRQNHSKMNWMKRNSKTSMQNCNINGYIYTQKIALDLEENTSQGTGGNVT